MAIIDTIITRKEQGKRQLVLLLDPEKGNPDSRLREWAKEVDYVFVGGSTGNDIASYVREVKKMLSKPVILFPGNCEQFTKEADALLYLSVMNSRNAELLVGQHIKSARRIHESGVEVIPMGYILVDGGKMTSVLKATGCTPLLQTDISQIVDTALASELLGKRLVYLEAGSGAAQSVQEEVVRAVKQVLTIPLIVGGGVCDTHTMERLFEAGADLVVIGNHFEQHPEQIPEFIQCLKRNEL